MELADSPAFVVLIRARAWSRAADDALRPHRLTHIQLLVLDTASALVREQGDAVSQARIARRAGLGPMVASRAACALEARGFVSRGPCFESAEWRVFVTDEGERALRAARRVLPPLPASPEGRSSSRD